MFFFGDKLGFFFVVGWMFSGFLALGTYCSHKSWECDLVRYIGQRWPRFVSIVDLVARFFCSAFL